MYQWSNIFCWYACFHKVIWFYLVWYLCFDKGNQMKVSALYCSWSWGFEMEKIQPCKVRVSIKLQRASYLVMPCHSILSERYCDSFFVWDGICIVLQNKLFYNVLFWIIRKNLMFWHFISTFILDISNLFSKCRMKKISPLILFCNGRP